MRFEFEEEEIEVLFYFSEIQFNIFDIFCTNIPLNNN